MHLPASKGCPCSSSKVKSDACPPRSSATAFIIVAPVIAAGDGAHFTASGKPSSSIRYRTTTCSADIMRRQVWILPRMRSNRPPRGVRFEDSGILPDRCEEFLFDVLLSTIGSMCVTNAARRQVTG